MSAPNQSQDVDLRVDFNTMDETGLPWVFVDQANDPELIIPGTYIVARSGAARAVALVVDVVDGIAHVQPARGSVAGNRHLLAGRRLAS